MRPEVKAAAEKRPWSPREVEELRRQKNLLERITQREGKLFDDSYFQRLMGIIEGGVIVTGSEKSLRSPSSSKGELSDAERVRLAKEIVEGRGEEWKPEMEKALLDEHHGHKPPYTDEIRHEIIKNLRAAGFSAGAAKEAVRQMLAGKGNRFTDWLKRQWIELSQEAENHSLGPVRNDDIVSDPIRNQPNWGFLYAKGLNPLSGKRSNKRGKILNPAALILDGVRWIGKTVGKAAGGLRTLWGQKGESELEAQKNGDAHQVQKGDLRRTENASEVEFVDLNAMHAEEYEAYRRRESLPESADELIGVAIVGPDGSEASVRRLIEVTEESNLALDTTRIMKREMLEKKGAAEEGRDPSEEWRTVTDVPGKVSSKAKGLGERTPAEVTEQEFVESLQDILLQRSGQKRLSSILFLSEASLGRLTRVLAEHGFYESGATAVRMERVVNGKSEVGYLVRVYTAGNPLELVLPSGILGRMMAMAKKISANATSRSSYRLPSQPEVTDIHTHPGDLSFRFWERFGGKDAAKADAITFEKALRRIEATKALLEKLKEKNARRPKPDREREIAELEKALDQASSGDRQEAADAWDKIWSTPSGVDGKHYENLGRRANREFESDRVTIRAIIARGAQATEYKISFKKPRGAQGRTSASKLPEESTLGVDENFAEMVERSEGEVIRTEKPAERVLPGERIEQAKGEVPKKEDLLFVIEARLSNLRGDIATLEQSILAGDVPAMKAELGRLKAIRRSVERGRTANLDGQETAMLKQIERDAAREAALIRAQKEAGIYVEGDPFKTEINRRQRLREVLKKAQERMKSSGDPELQKRAAEMDYRRLEVQLEEIHEMPLDQIKEKARALKRLGFNTAEIDQLIHQGVMGEMTVRLTEGELFDRVMFAMEEAETLTLKQINDLRGEIRKKMKEKGIRKEPFYPLLGKLQVLQERMLEMQGRRPAGEALLPTAEKKRIKRQAEAYLAEILDLRRKLNEVEFTDSPDAINE